MSIVVTQEYLEQLKFKAFKSNMNYDINDLNRIITDPNYEFFKESGMNIKYKDIFNRIPSCEKIYGVLEPDYKLKVGKLEPVLNSRGEQVLDNLGKPKFKKVKKIIKQGESLPEDINLIQGTQLSYKCGDQRGKVNTVPGIYVIYQQELIVHFISYDILFPEKLNGSLFNQHYTTNFKITKLDKTDRLKLLKNIYKLNNLDIQQMNNLITELRRRNELDKQIQEIKKHLDKQSLNVEENEKIINQFYGITQDIENKFKVKRAVFLDLLLSWYYLTNKKEKWITTHSQKCGVYNVPNEILPFITTLRTTGDIAQFNIKKVLAFNNLNI